MGRYSSLCCRHCDCLCFRAVRCSSSRGFRDCELLYPRKYEFLENGQGLRGWGSTDRYDVTSQLATDWTAKFVSLAGLDPMTSAPDAADVMNAGVGELVKLWGFGGSTHAIDLLSFVQSGRLDYKDSAGLDHSFG